MQESRTYTANMPVSLFKCFHVNSVPLFMADKALGIHKNASVLEFIFYSLANHDNLLNNSKPATLILD